MSQFADKTFLFVAGVHRSGTTLLHDALSAHPEVTGFFNTGAPADEGQHLQSVFPTAMQFGGPGKFAFDHQSYMDESHPLATAENADNLYVQWKNYWDPNKNFLLEKSPPTIVRTRFFQKLFPGSSFVIILRHPIAVAYATAKWCQSSIFALLEHTLRCYERLLADKDRLTNALIVRYEDFVQRPQQILHRLQLALGLNEHSPVLEIKTDINNQYFQSWHQDLESLQDRGVKMMQTFKDIFENRMASFGYTFDAIDRWLNVPWIDSFD